ncbi:hypothetical protein Q8A67_023373 [Cirrhinus molitorella]|uniref:Uncharacterized protein n=1 Tax=Cirrhinus molitorella TaxID=172907 RepID=A0AA88TB57_9TELE|nr:hypothetical protein Q8A67_023373 [Cirrhinus molitorella]
MGNGQRMPGRILPRWHSSGVPNESCGQGTRKACLSCGWETRQVCCRDGWGGKEEGKQREAKRERRGM